MAAPEVRDSAPPPVAERVDSLVLQLDGTRPDVPDAALRLLFPTNHARSETLKPSDLRTRWRDIGSQRCEQLIVTGSPPEDEVGAWLSVVAAGVIRPRRVARVDLSRAVVRTGSLARFLGQSAPAAVAQCAASASALALQSAAAQWLKGRRPVPLDRTTVERVCYVRSHAGSPATVGGGITHTHELIRALEQIGVRVDPFTNDAAIVATARGEDPPPCDWRLVGSARVGRAIPASAAFAADVALVRAAHKAARASDFIYQRNTRFSIAGALLSAASHRPLVLEYNGTETFFARHWIPTPFMGTMQAAERIMLGSASLIVVVSDVLRRELLDRGIGAERIVTIPNAVNTDRFPQIDYADVRAELGFQPDETVIGFLGTFGNWHGAPVLAEAFVRLAARSEKLRLLLIGDGPERPQVLDRLAEGGCRDRVTAMGRVPPARVPALLGATDILASPHVEFPGAEEFFGSPVKIFEYMATGKPIVASDLAQIGEVLEHERSALLVPPGDVAALADALSRAASDPDLRERLGKASREDAVARHTWQAAAGKLRDAAEAGARG